MSNEVTVCDHFYYLRFISVATCRSALKSHQNLGFSSVAAQLLERQAVWNDFLTVLARKSLQLFCTLIASLRLSVIGCLIRENITGPFYRNDRCTIHFARSTKRFLRKTLHHSHILSKSGFFTEATVKFGNVVALLAVPSMTRLILLCDKP